MKTRLLFLLLFVRAACLSAGELPIAKHPQRELILRSLQRLVDESGKTPENHFFFVRRADGKDWVFWREGSLLWDTIMEPYHEKKGPTELRARAVWDLRLYVPWKPIHLRSDVVSQPEEIGSSTYLVTKAFVAEIVYECVQDGDLVVIRKNLAAPR